MHLGRCGIKCAAGRLVGAYNQHTHTAYGHVYTQALHFCARRRPRAAAPRRARAAYPHAGEQEARPEPARALVLRAARKRAWHPADHGGHACLSDSGGCRERPWYLERRPGRCLEAGESDHQFGDVCCS